MKEIFSDSAAGLLEEPKILAKGDPEANHHSSLETERVCNIKVEGHNIADLIFFISKNYSSQICLFKMASQALLLLQ
jgi:hypothetical protein